MEEQERQGLLVEEIAKLVDGVEADIKSGYIRSPLAAVVQLTHAAARSPYATEFKLALAVLEFLCDSALERKVVALGNRLFGIAALRELRSRNLVINLFKECENGEEQKSNQQEDRQKDQQERT